MDMVREEKMEEVEDKAELAAEDRLIDLLLPPTHTAATAAAAVHEPGSNVIQLPAATPQDDSHSESDSEERPGDREQRTREKLRQQFREGKLDERTVELDVRDRNQPSFEVITNQGSEEMDINLHDMLPGLFGQRTKKRKINVADAFGYLEADERSRR